MLDVFSGDKSPAVCGLPEEGNLGIKNATFAWTDYNETSTDQRFLLRVDEEIVFQKGKVNLIVGPTGSGKTAMLLALLGEMHCIPVDPDSYVSLPRSGRVAYVPQEPWIQSDSIRVSLPHDLTCRFLRGVFSRRKTSCLVRRSTKSATERV